MRTTNTAGGTTGRSTTARLSAASPTAAGHQVVMIHADRKADAQDAIKVAKAWLRATGARFKLVYFHENIGTQWSNLGRSYSARIAYAVPS